MIPSNFPTPFDSFPPTTAALRIGRDLNFREENQRALQLLPKALRNFDEADTFPMAGCVIRTLRADEHWCELCGQHDAPEDDVCGEHEIPLCAACVDTIE